MSGQILKELKQKKPFPSLEAEAIVNIAKTFYVISEPFGELLQAYGLTMQQYNVLRILRGQGRGGLNCGEVGERMIHRDSDITRLMDRLVKSSLIERTRLENDRRVVLTKITENGLKVLAKLDRPVQQCNKEYLGRISKTKLTTLINILEEVRTTKN